jgi:hypothetical protein
MEVEHNLGLQLVWKLVRYDLFHVLLRMPLYQSAFLLFSLWTIFILFFAGIYVAIDRQDPLTPCGLGPVGSPIKFYGAFAFSLETCTFPEHSSILRYLACLAFRVRSDVLTFVPLSSCAFQAPLSATAFQIRKMVRAALLSRGPPLLLDSAQRVFTSLLQQLPTAPGRHFLSDDLVSQARHPSDVRISLRRCH